jgi:hypothetical protein
MQCGLCGASGDQFEGSFRDLGARTSTFVCGECQALADRIQGVERDECDDHEPGGCAGSATTGTTGTIGADSGIASYSTQSATRSGSEPPRENGVTTKYGV